MLAFYALPYIPSLVWLIRCFISTAVDSVCAQLFCHAMFVNSLSYPEKVLAGCRSIQLLYTPCAWAMPCGGCSNTHLLQQAAAKLFPQGLMGFWSAAALGRYHFDSHNVGQYVCIQLYKQQMGAKFTVSQMLKGWQCWHMHKTHKLVSHFFAMHWAMA